MEDFNMEGRRKALFVVEKLRVVAFVKNENVLMMEGKEGKRIWCVYIDS